MVDSEMTQLLATEDEDVENANGMTTDHRSAWRFPLAIAVPCMMLACAVLLLGSRTAGPSVASQRSASEINAAILTLNGQFSEEATEAECMNCKSNADKKLACSAFNDVTAGKITPQKGHEQLVTAFTKICLGMKCMRGFDLPKWCNEGTDINCLTCMDNIDKKKVCTTLQRVEAGDMKQEEAQETVARAFWKPAQCFQLPCMRELQWEALPKILCNMELGEEGQDEAEKKKNKNKKNKNKNNKNKKNKNKKNKNKKNKNKKKRNETAVEAAGGLLSNEQKLAHSLACQNVSLCGHCLTSAQCAGHAVEPRIFCCPRIKKCIDVRSSDTWGCPRINGEKNVCPSKCSERRSQQPNYPLDCDTKCPGWDPLTWVQCKKEDDIPSCISCKLNIKKQKACKALYEGEVGILDRSAAGKLIKESFWKPEECFKLPCMRDLKLELFCKDEMMEHANKHGGKGLEHIKTLDADAEIESNARLPAKEDEGPSLCTSCAANINKQQACKALYEGEVGVLDQKAAGKLIQASFWKPEECLKLPCMQEFNFPLFCKDEMMELANQYGGKGLEQIKAFGVDAEIEKEAGLPKEAAPSCSSCTTNINKTQACKALYEGETGILDRSAAGKLLRGSFWKPEECFKLPCMQDFDIPLFCQDEMMKLANQNGGKGVEHIQAIGADVEMKKDVVQEENFPSCTTCKISIKKQQACKALYEGETGIVDRIAAGKMIKESFWKPEECFKLPCMRDLKLPLFCKDEMMELANQNGGKGLEFIKAIGVEAEIEKDAVPPQKEKVEAAGELLSNEQKLAQSLACRDVPWCGHCLTSDQCAGHALEPKIFCCPRIKKCIDVRSSDTWGCPRASGEKNVCPNKCSERKSQQPNYPLDCDTKCPDWDPLSWVQCKK